MRTGRSASGIAYSEWGEQRMVVDENKLKLIINDGPVKLYDLKADPGEKTNLASARPADVTRLRAALDARYAQGKALGAKFGATAPASLTPEQVEALRALGYIE